MAWDISLDGGFHELTWIAGRTALRAGNSRGTDLLVINDSGAYIYKPSLERSGPIEIKSEADYDKVVRWYEEGLIQILDQRPDIDHRAARSGRAHRHVDGAVPVQHQHARLDLVHSA